MAVRTSAIDVVVKMRGQKTFAAQTRKSAAELEAMGVKGSKALSSLALAGQRLQNFGSKMTKYVTAPVIGAGFVAGKFAIDFDESMRNVNSIAQLPEKNLQKLERQVLAMAGPTAQAPKTLADSLYDLVSSGFDASESLQILRPSAKAATAGLTEAAVSTKAMAAVLNAYHLPASRAKSISDILFRTVDRGVLTFEDLAQNIGDVLPFASSLNVGLDQVGASIATMTKEGISAPETMTRIKNVMVTMLKPGDALKKTIKSLGFESGEAMVKQLGFQGALDKLSKTTGGSKEEMAKLFPNIRALGGALALTGDNASSAHKDLRTLADSAGATNRALGQQKQSLAYKWHQLSAQFQAIAIKFAPPLLDALGKLAGILKSVGEWFNKLPKPVRDLALQMAILAAATGPVLWLFGALLKGPFKILMASKGVILFFQALSATMAALDVGLITATSAMVGFDVALLAIPLAVVAVAAGLVLLYLKVKWFRDKVNAVINFFKDHPFAALLIPVIGPFVTFAILVIKHFGQIKAAAQTAFSSIKGIVDKFLIGPIKWVVDKLQWFIDKVQNIRLPWEDQTIHAHGAILTGPGSNPFGGLQGPAGPRGHIPKRAMGGPMLPGGTALVGERGPELATFPFGGQVFSTDQTKKLLASDRDAPTIVIPIHLNGRVIAEEVVRAGETARARK